MSKIKTSIIFLSSAIAGFGYLCVMGTACTFKNHKESSEARDYAWTTDCFGAFLSSVISAPQKGENVVYYAGTSNNVFVLVHKANDNLRFWNFKCLNLEKSVWCDFPCDPGYWVMLKDSDETTLRHWDWRKEIVDFVQALPRNSALVKPNSSWLQVDADTNNVLWLVKDYIVEVTLCESLKRGDRLCTVQLYDSDENAKKRVLSEARKSGKKIIRRQDSASKGLEYAQWKNGRLLQIGDLQGDKAFCIDNEIVAPFEFAWNCTYDGLIHFDERVAIDAYKKRVKRMQEPD